MQWIVFSDVIGNQVLWLWLYDLRNISGKTRHRWGKKHSSLTLENQAEQIVIVAASFPLPTNYLCTCLGSSGLTTCGKVETFKVFQRVFTVGILHVLNLKVTCSEKSRYETLLIDKLQYQSLVFSLLGSGASTMKLKSITWNYRVYGEKLLFFSHTYMYTFIATGVQIYYCTSGFMTILEFIC